MNRVPSEKCVDELVIEPKEEPVLQEIPLEEQLKTKQKKQNKKAKSKNANTQNEKEPKISSETDTSKSGSWESIILETPDGVRREFIAKTSTETKPTQDKLKLKPKHKEGEDTSVLIVTRAQAKQAKEQGKEDPNTESSTSQKKMQENKKIEAKESRK